MRVVEFYDRSQSMNIEFSPLHLANVSFGSIPLDCRTELYCDTMRWSYFNMSASMGLPLMSPLSKAMTDVTHQPIMNSSPLMMLMMVIMTLTIMVFGRVTTGCDKVELDRWSNDVYVNASVNDHARVEMLTYDDDLVRMMDDMYDNDSGSDLSMM